MKSASLSQLVSERRLGYKALLGPEQGGIDLPRSLESLDVDRQIDQRMERAYRAQVACFGSFDAQVFGLAVDAFAGSTLVVDDVVQGALTIQGDTHQATSFLVDVLWHLGHSLSLCETAHGHRSLPSTQGRAEGSGSVGCGSLWCAGIDRWGACASREDRVACHQDHGNTRDGRAG
jgi:hypothetical protein